MRLQAVLKYVNGLIALVLLAVLAAGYYWVWRPMPNRSGSVEAPISAPASATRDELGVPHIRAASIEDAVFLQGYVTAQDRMWQMDAIRRLATGQLSEVLGTRTLEVDRESRRLRIGRLAAMHARSLESEDHKWLAAYARGVNHYLETHRGKLPLEFTILRYQPRIWTISDSIAVALQMSRDLTSIWQDELGKAAALAVAKQPDLVYQLLPQRRGGLLQPGSNAWAIAGKHTASGKPILASDPHLNYGSPSTWHMAHLEAPGLNVRGVALPGLPGIIIGHNARVAWGVTNLQFDVQDLYVERLDVSSGRYLHRGQPQQARQEYDVIRVRDAKPVEVTNWVTVHGPVWQSIGGQPLTLRWIAAEPKQINFPFIDINRASDWNTFRAALRRFTGLGLNYIYADVDGNIGHQVVGKLPIRRNFPGDVPADGSSGQYEWDGFIPFDDLPTSYNPADGVVLSSNEDPFPAEWKYAVNGDFDATYRARQARHLLAARSGWKPEDMLTIQKDVYSGFLHYLAGVAAATPGADAEAVRILRAWNGQTEKGLAAPFIANLFAQQLQIEFVKRAVGKPLSSDVYPSTATVEALLRARPSSWYADWNKTIVQCLAAAMDEGRRLQGRDPSRWDWGVQSTVELKNPIVSQLPWVGRYEGIQRVPLSGSRTSVKQVTRTLGPSMRFVADLSNWDRSLNNITLGQSGHAFSANSKDQWDAYYNGTSFPMPWSKVEGDVLEFEPK